MMEKKPETEAELSFDETTAVFLRHLRLHGLMPYKGRSYNYFVTRGLLVFYFCTSLINWSMVVVYCIRMCFQKKIMVETICESVLVFGVSIRYYMLIIRRSEYIELLDECREIWSYYRTNERNAIAEFVRKIQYVFFLLICSTIGVVVLYTTTALTTKIEMENGTQKRVLPYKWYVENPEDYWPGYTTILTVQTVAVWNAGSYMSIVDTCIPLLTMICSGFLRCLSDRFFDIANNNNDDDDFDDTSFLLECTKLHRRVLKLCSKLEKFARSIFLVQVMCTTYNMSLLAVKLAGTNPDRLKYIPILSITVSQLFVCQWSPDYLLDESLEVSTAAYFNTFGWMRGRLGKLLLIVMTRAQKPVQMTAGGFVNLSLESYGRMITSAFSFFTMLRKFNL